MSSVGYLTPAWVAAANAALQNLAHSADAGSVGYRIEDDSGAEVFSYTLILGPSETGAVTGTDDAGVVLILRRETAVGIAKHQLSAQREFLNGSMRIDGDINVLLTSQVQAAQAELLLSELQPEFE